MRWKNRVIGTSVYSFTTILVTFLVGLSLGAALISIVLTLHYETENTFKREAGLFDLIVGAKGSPSVRKGTVTVKVTHDASTSAVSHRRIG